MTTETKGSTRHAQTSTIDEDFQSMIKPTKINISVAKTRRMVTNQMQFVEEIPIETSIKPHPRSGHRAVATESDLWIWGGYFPGDDDQQERMFRELWRYNFALQRWTLEETTGDGPAQGLASHSSKNL